MRIDRIDLIRFGHFADRTIELPSRWPDYYVIYGDNEAGKSTLLRGISALFFGVPARTPDVHSCKSTELRIGATISEGEKTFSFRRRKGISGTLLNLNDGQIDEGALTSFVRELDRERFEQFFGLNHQRLREGGEELLRGKGDIGSALFQAAGLLDLRNLLDGLDADAKELFSAKSRTKVIPCAIGEYKEARAEARRLAISAGTVKQKQADLEAAKEAHERLKKESEVLQRELVRLRRIVSNKPDIARLQELRNALLALETVPVLPIDARRRRDEAASAFADAIGQIQILNQNIAERRERIEILPVSGVFKAHAKEIEELNAGTSDYSRSVNDRPKRVNERAEAIQLAEAQWKEVWPQRPVSDAEELRSAYSRKAETYDLITEHARLSTALTQAEDDLRSGKDDQDRLREELALHPDPGDPSGLIATIEQAKSLGDTDEAIARFKSEIERLTAGANRDLEKLSGWQGSINEFETMKTPLLRTIDGYAREWEAMTAIRKARTSRLSEMAEAIRSKQVELGRLAVEVARVGENQLIETRARRDQLWRLIRTSVFDITLSREDAQQQSDSSTPLEIIFEEHLHRADEIADLRFANAKDVAIHDRLVKEIVSAEAEQYTIREEIANLDTQDQELRQRWTAEWDVHRCVPLSPTEMKEWMQLRQAILDRLQQAREKEKDLIGLQNRASSAADQISARLSEFGPTVARQNESLAIVLRVAEGIAKTIQEERRIVEDLRRRLQLLGIEKRQAKLDDAKNRLSEWSRRWSSVARELLLPDNATPQHVGGAISVLERVFDHLKDAERLEYRVKRIGDNIELFEKRASQLIAATDPSLSSVSPAIAVSQLQSRLQEMGRAEAEREALEAQSTKDQLTISNCSNKAQLAENSLKKLKELAKCDHDQQLEAMIAAAEQKREKQEEYDRIAQSLIERNAAPDVGQVEQEASEYELDSLQSAIISSENRQQALQDEVFTTGSEYGRLLQEFERLQASEESAIQAQKAEDALARIRPAVAQYLRLRLASEVLHRAIESYREKHQGPVLSRASELFSSLTLGDHSGLTTGFGNDDKPILVAIRKNKEHVEIEGLSDGTRDQLYLALRLAAIEHHVQTVAPCPVILDDILVNSDDARAAAALTVLADLAKCTQVLFFTHHRHLAEFGIKARAQTIDLDASAAAAT